MIITFFEKIVSKFFVLYFPYSEEYGVYLQQDGFLDKELEPVNSLSNAQRPINQFWSWDRILRSVYIKQADVLQGFYLFESHFDRESLARHFDFVIWTKFWTLSIIWPSYGVYIW